MTIHELLDALDGRGIVYEDTQFVQESLKELNLTLEDRVERAEGFFSVLRLHREDLVRVGFSSEEVGAVGDDDLRQLAENVGEALTDPYFWDALETLAEERFGLKKS